MGREARLEHGPTMALVRMLLGLGAAVPVFLFAAGGVSQEPRALRTATVTTPAQPREDRGPRSFYSIEVSGTLSGQTLLMSGDVILVWAATTLEQPGLSEPAP